MQTVMSEGKVCVLDIDVQGVKQVKETDLNAYCVFIMPPSMEELECRLRDRGTESPESLQKRLDAAKEEIEYGECYLQVVEDFKFMLCILCWGQDGAASCRKLYVVNAETCFSMCRLTSVFQLPLLCLHLKIRAW